MKTDSVVVSVLGIELKVNWDFVTGTDRIIWELADTAFSASIEYPSFKQYQLFHMLLRTHHNQDIEAQLLRHYQSKIEADYYASSVNLADDIPF